MPRLKAISLLSLATSLMVPAAFAQSTNNATPGTVNYVEGQATLNGQVLSSRAVGRAQIAPNQTISTENGRVEILLTPGVFLRLGDNSAVTMVSPSLTRTEVQVDRGKAEVEVDLLYKQNDLLIDQGPAQAKLLKNGLYEFDVAANDLRVFDGEAAVSPAQTARKWINVKAHHELEVTGEQAKPRDFNAGEAAQNDPLYSWSKLRADYLGQANLTLAQEYAGNTAFYPGWFWDPAMYAYTWLPYDGMIWSPFGFGFYSPWYLWGGGFIYPGYGFGGGFYRAGYGIVHGPYINGHAAPAAHGFAEAPAAHAYAGGFGGGGFHGGGFGGGGFHGGGFGGGGFHGGFGGGGFHGGGGGRR